MTSNKGWNNLTKDTVAITRGAVSQGTVALAHIPLNTCSVWVTASFYKQGDAQDSVADVKVS